MRKLAAIVVCAIASAAMLVLSDSCALRLWTASAAADAGSDASTFMKPPCDQNPVGACRER